MNRKHLLWHIFDMMEKMDIRVDDFIESINMEGTMFSEKPQEGEISVAKALYERYDAYVKVKQND